MPALPRPDAPEELPPDPKRIDHRDETVRTMATYLRKNAEFAAKQEMERLITEAKRQEGDAPDHL